MIFICGIHGVGKSYYANQMFNNDVKKVYTASQLIYGDLYNNCDKRVDNIDMNQEKLISELQNVDRKNAVLVGHTCLVDPAGTIKRIDINYFKRMDIETIYVIVDKIECISANLMKRDNVDWQNVFLHRFQNEEVKYAEEIAKECKKTCYIIYKGRKVSGLEDVVNDGVVLPIKPIYSDMIMSGIKKYEYRKRLCKKDIEKIYIYSTSPVKKIIGEADVVDKIIMPKQDLWNCTRTFSGITEAFYNEYFKNTEYACAYKLGETKRYTKAVDLKDININYVPQSYVYMSNIE